MLEPASEGTCTAEGQAGGSLLIRGDILAPGTVYRGGSIFIDDGEITCVGCECDCADATLTCADAVVSPGLINPHDHITFANNWPIGDGVDRYEHRHDWRVGLNGHASLDTNGGASPETVLAAELRFVMGGATLAASAGGESGLLRNLDSGGGRRPRHPAGRQRHVPARRRRRHPAVERLQLRPRADHEPGHWRRRGLPAAHRRGHQRIREQRAVVHAQERLETTADGRCRYDFRHAWKNGVHAVVLDPLDLIARLCALIPPPRFHMLRYHGVLAAHAKVRPENGWDEVTTKHPTRHPWAWLLQRVFAVDIMTCPLGVLGQSIWRARQYRENEAHVTLSSSATHE